MHARHDTLCPQQRREAVTWLQVLEQHCLQALALSASRSRTPASAQGAKAPCTGDSTAERALKSGGTASGPPLHLTLSQMPRRARGSPFPCPRVHFRRLVFPWTDVGMGNCSYLDTCRHMKTCRYVHYELDDAQPGDVLGVATPGGGSGAKPGTPGSGKARPAVPSYLAVRTYLVNFSFCKKVVSYLIPQGRLYDDCCGLR